MGNESKINVLDDFICEITCEEFYSQTFDNENET